MITVAEREVFAAECYVSVRVRVSVRVHCTALPDPVMALCQADGSVEERVWTCPYDEMAELSLPIKLSPT